MSHLQSALSLVTAIKGSSLNIRQASHEALAHASIHALEHGDVTLFDRIFDALGKASDRQLMVKWCKEATPAIWNKETVSFQLNKAKRKAMNAANISFAEMMAKTPWHDYGKDREDIDREFDIIARLRAAVKGYDNAKAEGRKTKNDWAAGAIASLLSKIEAEHIEVEHAQA